mgnify:CR=1 FL=1
MPQRGDALLLVDVQNDFLPGGALGVPEGDAVIAPLNECAARFAQLGLPVVASRDWHPPDHCSFRPQGGPWPPHCVAGTPGAAFAATLRLPPATIVVSKATDPAVDAYSAFQGTGLAESLAALGCRRTWIGGLATDYCVRATALDAMAAGLQVLVLATAVRAVDVRPGDGARALEELRDRGATIVAP